jgi:hypothetical protein
MSYVIPAWRRWPLASGLWPAFSGPRLSYSYLHLVNLVRTVVRGPARIRSALQRVYGLGSIGPWFIDMLCVYIFSAIISFLARCSLLQGAGAARWALIKLQLQAEKGSMRRRRAQPCGDRPRYTEALSVQQTSKPCTMRQQPAAGEPPIPCLPPPNKVRESESLD